MNIPTIDFWIETSRLKSELYLRLKKRKVFKIIKGGPVELIESPVRCKILKNEVSLW